MSRFKPYPAYKDSGVEWLGDVPEGWTVCKLDFRYSVELGKMLDEKQITNTSPLPYLRNQDVQWGKINTDDLPEMDIYPIERERYTIRNDDLLVCEGGDIGRAAIWKGEDAIFGYQKALHRLRHRCVQLDTAEFLYFVLQAAKLRGAFEESESKSTIAHLPADKFRQYRFAFPPLFEQVVIASFLVYQTARIDALIEEQRRLIELLKEKRRGMALAALADPKLPLTRIEHAVDVISRPVRQKEGETYIPIGLFNRDRGLFHKEAREVQEMGDSDFFWVRSGDLVISGQFAWEGAVALAGDDEEGVVVSHRYPVLRGRNGVALTEYVYAILTTKHGDFLLNECSRGAAGRNRPLNLAALLKEQIRIPSKAIQELVRALVQHEAKVLAKCREQISFLQERRAALISAVVTGKIDVRGWQPPASDTLLAHEIQESYLKSAYESGSQ